MAIGTDMQVKEFVCSCCKDPLAILSGDKKRWAERNQKQILYEFQALSLAMENRCFGITKPFLVIFMIFKSLFGPSCQPPASTRGYPQVTVVLTEKILNLWGALLARDCAFAQTVVIGKGRLVIICNNADDDPVVGENMHGMNYVSI